MDGVRSYRHARRSTAKGRFGAVVTLSAPQLAFGIVGLIVGVVCGGLVGGPALAGMGAAAGPLVGVWLGSKRADGRNPFQWLLAATGRRRGVWSPRWGRLTVTTRVVRWSCIVDETKGTSCLTESSGGPCPR
jgi:hypothetical protein